MGLCYSCCKNTSTDCTPDIETRRQQQVEAAERRQREQESKGIRNPERVKERQSKQLEIERKQESVSYNTSQQGLRWQVG